MNALIGNLFNVIGDIFVYLAMSLQQFYIHTLSINFSVLQKEKCRTYCLMSEI